ALTVRDLAIPPDPSLSEARFNRALALERLHLDDLSRIEWQESLRLDGRSPWSDEARSHLAVQGEPPTTAWNADYRRIEAAVDGSDQATLTKTIELAIQSARDWAEEQLLDEWPRAVVGGEDTAAGRRLAPAPRLGPALSPPPHH